jgi:hypothetical protein
METIHIRVVMTHFWLSALSFAAHRRRSSHFWLDVALGGLKGYERFIVNQA